MRNPFQIHSPDCLPEVYKAHFSPHWRKAHWILPKKTWISVMQLMQPTMLPIDSTAMVVKWANLFSSGKNYTKHTTNHTHTHNKTNRNLVTLVTSAILFPSLCFQCGPGWEETILPRGRTQGSGRQSVKSNYCVVPGRIQQMDYIIIINMYSTSQKFGHILYYIYIYSTWDYNRL